MSGIWHFEEKLQKWKRIPPSEIPLFGKSLGENRELSGVIGESGKIGNYRDSNFSRFLPRITNSGKSGMIGSEFWRSVLAIIDHVFAPAEHCRSVTSPISDRGGASSPQKQTLVPPRVSHCRLIIQIMSSTLMTLSPIDVMGMHFITSFLRVTLRDVVTMFTFAIVSSNAWVWRHGAFQCKTCSVRSPARKALPNTI
jgi:hypothetical protein